MHWNVTTGTEIISNCLKCSEIYDLCTGTWQVCQDQGFDQCHQECQQNGADGLSEEKQSDAQRCNLIKRFMMVQYR